MLLDILFVAVRFDSPTASPRSLNYPPPFFPTPRLSEPDLERLLGRKTMEVEILKEALAKPGAKKRMWLPPSQPKDGSR